MYSQEFVDSLDSYRAEFSRSIGEYTRDVLEKTDLQVRKNECFASYVKNLSDVCLDQSQKQTSLMRHYANKIEYEYVQRQVSLNLSNSQITPTKVLSGFSSPMKQASAQKKSALRQGHRSGQSVGGFNSSAGHKTPN